MQFITLLGDDVFIFNLKPNKRQEGLKNRNQLHHQPNIGLFQKLEAPHKEESLGVLGLQVYLFFLKGILQKKNKKKYYHFFCIKKW